MKLKRQLFVFLWSVGAERVSKIPDETGLCSIKLVWLIQKTGWSADQRNLKMIEATLLAGTRWLSTISYPTRPRGIIVNFYTDGVILCNIFIIISWFWHSPLFASIFAHDAKAKFNPSICPYTVVPLPTVTTLLNPSAASLTSSTIVSIQSSTSGVFIKA